MYYVEPPAITSISDVMKTTVWGESGFPARLLGESIFRRIAHIGVSSVEDPRAPFQVIEVLDTVGTILAEEGAPEAARQAAVALSEIGEVAVERG